MPKIKVVIFDWGGVLGHSGQRHIFLYSPTRALSRSAIKSDAIHVIKELHKKGIVLGILSNTRYSRQDMNKALKRLGMDKYFKFAIYSSDDFSSVGGPKMCRKPCEYIFKTAIEISRDYIPYIRSSNILYVGDNYSKDMRGAKRMGMQTGFLVESPYTLESHSKALSRLRSHDFVLESLSDILNLFK